MSSGPELGVLVEPGTAVTPEPTPAAHEDHTDPKATGKKDSGLPKQTTQGMRLPLQLPQAPPAAAPGPASTSPEHCPGPRAGSAERAQGWYPLPASRWSRPRCRAQ